MAPNETAENSVQKAATAKFANVGLDAAELEAMLNEKREKMMVNKSGRTEISIQNL